MYQNTVQIYIYRKVSGVRGDKQRVPENFRKVKVLKLQYTKIKLQFPYYNCNSNKIIYHARIFYNRIKRLSITNILYI